MSFFARFLVPSSQTIYHPYKTDSFLGQSIQEMTDICDERLAKKKEYM
jgi:hypothetical protein